MPAGFCSVDSWNVVRSRMGDKCYEVEVRCGVVGLFKFFENFYFLKGRYMNGHNSQPV